ncbi:MAG: hypothetical protein ACREGE_03995 [Candidatus Microsaccharimonas sp.]
MKQSNWKPIVTISAVLVLIAGVIWYLIFAGILVVQFKSSEGVVRASPIVCDAEVVKEYNEIALTPVIEEGDRVKLGERINSQVATLKEAHGNFNEDATCIFIAYSGAIATGNAEAAQQFVDAITELAEKYQYPSSQLVDVMGLESMQVRVDALMPSEGDSQLGSG